MGARKRPFYRFVVADARSPRDGRFIESVGYYDPLRHPAVVHIDDQRIRHWMATGAKPSDAVRRLLELQGVLAPSPRPVKAAKPSETAPSQAAPEAGAAAPAETEAASSELEPEAVEGGPPAEAEAEAPAAAEPQLEEPVTPDEEAGAEAEAEDGDAEAVEEAPAEDA